MRSVPRQTGIDDGIWFIGTHIAIDIGVRAHTVLIAVVDAEVKTFPYMQLKIAHQFVTQIFEGVFALYACHFLLVLVEIGISDVK